MSAQREPCLIEGMKVWGDLVVFVLGEGGVCMCV